MRIREIQILNILGIQSLSFKPGTLTVLMGANGTGKTSVIETLRRVFEGGSDPGLLRKGAKFGECLLILDDGRKIKVRVSPRATTYEIENPDGSIMKAPRAFIEDLADSLAVDPLRFLTAKPKELAAALLEIMPITFEQSELQDAVGEMTYTVNTDLSLDGFNSLRKEIEEKRRDVNRSARDDEGMIRRLKSSLPDGDEYDWAARTKELRATLRDAEDSRSAELKAIDADEAEQLDNLRKEYEKLVNSFRADCEAKRNEKRAEWEPTIAKIHAAVGEAEERMRAKDRAEGLRAEIANVEQRYEQSTVASDHFTTALENLDELKQLKLADCPIPGLEVTADGVTYEGVAFEHVNKAARVAIVFQLSTLRKKKLPFILLDEAEALDAETWQAFVDGAPQSGFQVITARVGDGPLSINVIEPEPVPA